jgi:hypothetical protein
VSDIFREVEEDVRRERMEKLWKAYGKYAIAFLVLAFLGLGGWQLWQRHQKAEAEKAATTFNAAQRITNPQAAASAFSDLTKGTTAGYEKLAKLSKANAMFAAGQRKDAIDLYKQLADADSGPVGAVARLRAAWGLADTTTRDELGKLLAPLDEQGSAWRQMAEEVLAYADYRALDMKSAAARYEALEKDPQSPDALRARARAMAAFLKNGGAVTYGTVPPEVINAPGAAPGPATGPAATPAPPPAK